MPNPSSTVPASEVRNTQLALALRDRLASAQLRLVLVESCTAGRVAACLGVLPGISQWLCGSLVVYRRASKSAWLGVPHSLLDDPRHGPVSPAASRWLAQAALERTPEADLAVAITGDVGPGAPPQTDGFIFLAAARRTPVQQETFPAQQKTFPVQQGTSAATSDQSLASACTVTEQQQQLTAAGPRDNSDIAARQARLDEATEWTLRFAAELAAQS